jgi:hypothetical protein
MSLERITDPREIKHWMGHMETDYVYTLGIAGEKFFKEIKENAKIMGAKCKKCGLIYVPPRLFCEQCFEKLNDWVEVSKRGTVHTYTMAYIDVDGSKLKEPIVWAMIRIDDVHGGFVHKLGEVNPQDVKIGMRVEAVFEDREKRVGSILDIKYFKPVG